MRITGKLLDDTAVMGEAKQEIKLPDKMPVFLTNKDDILTYLGWTNTSLNTLIDVVREMKERMK